MYTLCTWCDFKAEKKLAAQSLDHEYGPISGLGDFTRLSAELAFGTSGGDIVKAGRVSSLLVCLQLL